MSRNEINADVSIREDLKIEQYDLTNLNDVVNLVSNTPQLKLAFKDAVATLEKIDHYKEHLKEVAKAVEEQFQIKKRMFNKVANLFYKHEVSKFKQEAEETLALYYAVFGENNKEE